MSTLRKCKPLAVMFLVIALVACAMTVTMTDTASARPKCCIYVMYCTVDPPIYCWEECIPIPCP